MHNNSQSAPRILTGHFVTSAEVFFQIKGSENSCDRPGKRMMSGELTLEVMRKFVKYFSAARGPYQTSVFRS
jgi:hypothetical protein